MLFIAIQPHKALTGMPRRSHFFSAPPRSLDFTKSRRLATLSWPEEEPPEFDPGGRRGCPMKLMTDRERPKNAFAFKGRICNLWREDTRINALN
jgi:hypothetical protein